MDNVRNCQANYLGFLVAATIVTFKLVVPAQHFSIAKASETMSDTGVLININLKV